MARKPKNEQPPQDEPEKPLPEGLRPEDMPTSGEGDGDGATDPSPATDPDIDPETGEFKPLPEGLRIEDVQPKPMEFAAKSLSGDVRDMILMHMRDIKVPWAMLSEDEQSDKIHAATSAGMDVVRRCFNVLRAQDFAHVHVTLGSWKVDKGVELKLFIAPTSGNIELLALHSKSQALLILSEASDFYGERAPAKPDKDQPELPLPNDEDESGED